MARTITVDGVDRTAVIPLDSFNFGEGGWLGQPELTGFEIDDPAAAIFFNGHRLISVVESSDTANPRLFTGFIAQRDLVRAPYATGSDRRLKVQVVDLNTLLDDAVISTAAANRGSETDYARVTWLIGTGEIASVTAGVVPNTNTVTMDAADYRGRTPREVLDECAEQSGKNYLVYWDDASASRRLFYDKGTGTSLTSTLRLSTVLADVDNTVTFAPERETLVRTADPARVYSKVRVEYDGGAVEVTNATTQTTFRRRETALYDSSIRSSTAATALGNSFLAEAATEEDTISCIVNLPATLVNQIKAGQRIQLKAPHLGIAAFTYYRVTKRIVAPAGKGETKSDVRYDLALELTNPKITRFVGRPGAAPKPTDGQPKPLPEATLTTGGTVNTNLYIGVYEQDPLDGTGPAKNTTGLGTGGYTGSWVYDNVAFSVSGCAAPYGQWRGWRDTELWYEFTAPADDSTTLGYDVTIPSTSYTGYNGGWRIGIYPAAPSTSVFHLAYPIRNLPDLANVVVTVPRSLISWGAVNSLVFSPNWRCARPVAVCKNLVGGPLDDGSFQSGRYEPPGSGTILTLTAISYSSGASGISPWVGGIGAVNGTNRTFTLISWDGTGVPQARVGPLEVPIPDLDYDASAKTVTLPYAPATGSLVTFRYVVQA